jgi:hypothetical protein
MRGCSRSSLGNLVQPKYWFHSAAIFFSSVWLTNVMLFLGSRVVDWDIPSYSVRFPFSAQISVISSRPFQEIGVIWSVSDCWRPVISSTIDMSYATVQHFSSTTNCSLYPMFIPK